MRDLLIGFTPDPDDAFAYHALVHGQVAIPGCAARFITEPIASLNRRASAGELDVAAISSVHYPHVAGAYRILRSGASVGRGYGPALAARSDLPLSALPRLEVAVPGDTTTAAALLRLFFPGVRTRPMPFEEIRPALVAGQVAAGVLIHEELLSYPEDGLRLLLCLGKEWRRRTQLPLPVGLNVAHRRLGPGLAREVARAVRDSIQRAIERPREATAWARTFGRGPGSPVALRFIHMFANADTVYFPRDCQAGLRELFARLHAAGLAPRAPAVRLVEPAGDRAVAAAAPAALAREA
jgi:1,4-dihydroxy-6-naphthoate synthase